MKTDPEPRLHQRRTCGEVQERRRQPSVYTICSPRRQTHECRTLRPWLACVSSGMVLNRYHLTATSVASPYGKVTPPKYIKSPCFDAGMVTRTPSARPVVSGPELFVQKLLIMSYLTRLLVAQDGPDQPGVVRLVEYPP